MKIGILGMGEVGEANRRYYSGKYEVYTYDPKYDIEFNLPDCDVYLICTGSEDVEGAQEGLEGLVIIESTVKIGTCTKIEEVVHCPQRFWWSDPQNRGVRRHRIISATSRELLKDGVDFYTKVDIPVYPVWPVEVAELSKYAENAYRGLQIAYAEELAIECDEHNIPFDRVREAIMTADDMHWLPEVRHGIHGACLPMAMDWLGHFKTVAAAKIADKEFQKNVHF